MECASVARNTVERLCASPYISKLERQDDMLLSRLYAFVEALGGHVEILAFFEDREVRISQFGDFPKLREALGAPPR
jgi:hypothetical protein